LGTAIDVPFSSNVRRHGEGIAKLSASAPFWLNCCQAIDSCWTYTRCLRGCNAAIAASFQESEAAKIAEV